MKRDLRGRITPRIVGRKCPCGKHSLAQALHLKLACVSKERAK